MQRTEDISTLELRKNLKDILSRVRYAGVHYRVMRHKDPVAVLVPVQVVQTLEKLRQADPKLAKKLEELLEECS